MEFFVAVLFAIAAIVNLAPVVGVVSNQRLEKLYAIEIDDPNLAILLRHRALLFGIAGAILLVCVFYSPLRGLGAIIGLFSMLSYVAVAAGLGGGNASIRKVLWVDVVASIALAMGIGIELFSR